MDIEEILSHGIDVHTTLNVQHIESLSEQIDLMTKVKVKERVPDQFIMNADALEVVDTSPSILIQRLKAGKVYKKERVHIAFDNFFTYENLVKLRELTLRTAADLMSQKEQVHQSQHTNLTPHITVAVSGSIYNEDVIREARRIANKEHAHFSAIYIDVFNQEDAEDKSDAQVHNNLLLAQSLGATIKVMYDNNIASGLNDWCIAQNVTKLVIGQNEKKGWKDYFKSAILDQLLATSNQYNIEIVPIRRIQHVTKVSGAQHQTQGQRWHMDIFKMLILQTLCVLLGMWIYEMHKNESSSIILLMFFISIIVLSMWTQSYVIGFIAALMNVFIFNYFFTTPRFTFEMYRFDYPITFVVSILASIVTSGLLKQIKRQYHLTKQQLYRTDILLQFNQSIKQSYTMEKILKNAGHQIYNLLNLEVTVYTVEDQHVQKTINIPDTLTNMEQSHPDAQVISWVINNRMRAGITTDTFPGVRQLYLPIGTDTLEVIIVIHFDDQPYMDAYDSSILESMINEVTLAVENVSLLRRSRQSMIRAEKESTRSNFLRSISHDIRTPLTTIMGNLDVLNHQPDRLKAPEYQRLISRTYDETLYLYTLVNNILALTKLENSDITIQKEPYLLPDLLEEIESIIQRRYQGRRISLSYDSAIKFIDVDSKLILQALFNLVENALTYTHEGKPIKVNCVVEHHSIKFEVADFGDGISEEELAHIFKPFYSKSFKDNKKSSIGLGLYLVKLILAQHHSQLHYRQNEPTGSVFYFNLPILSEKEVTS